MLAETAPLQESMQSPHPQFAQTVQALAEALTPTERRLVTSVLTHPRAAALASVTDLAREAGVHEATVSRLARKLGFDGYPAFRASLQEEFLPREETATRLQRTLQASTGGVLSSLVEQERGALAELTRHIGDDAIHTAARQLMAARRIYIFARGNAEALALTMANRFQRFGRDVRLLTGHARSLAEGVLDMGAQDVVLVYAFRRMPRSYSPLVEHAKEVGATTMVISDSIGPTLFPVPDTLLAAPRSGDADGFQTLTIPMAISNAVILAAGAGEETQTLQTLERLGSLIKRFER
jgi:DNA-binding MurR/RpiR family transcriptional regulator